MNFISQGLMHMQFYLLYTLEPLNAYLLCNLIKMNQTLLNSFLQYCSYNTYLQLLRQLCCADIFRGGSITFCCGLSQDFRELFVMSGVQRVKHRIRQWRGQFTSVISDLCTAVHQGTFSYTIEAGLLESFIENTGHRTIADQL